MYLKCNLFKIKWKILPNYLAYQFIQTPFKYANCEGHQIQWNTNLVLMNFIIYQDAGINFNGPIWYQIYLSLRI